MFKLIIISHEKIDVTTLNSIIRIKSVSWPYNDNEQLEWIEKNIKKEDFHVLLTKNDLVIAYMNLVNIDFKVNGNKVNGYGIGNVCTWKKGEGWGKELLIRTNRIIVEENKVGLLFCRSNLVKFYNLFGWKLVEKNKRNLSFRNDDIEVMIFNFDQNILKIEYFDRLF